MARTRYRERYAPNYMKAPKPLMQIEQLSDETQRLFDVLNNESDLPCVLIGVSFLDETVRSMLGKFLQSGSTSQRLLNPLGGAIGDFSTRCDLGYCLGLIKKQFYVDLKKLAEIRNQFAHNHLGTDFFNETIQALCRELKTPNLLSGMNAGKSIEQYSENERRQDARNRFTASIAMLSNFLLVDAYGIKNISENGA